MKLLEAVCVGLSHLAQTFVEWDFWEELLHVGHAFRPSVYDGLYNRKFFLQILQNFSAWRS